MKKILKMSFLFVCTLVLVAGCGEHKKSSDDDFGGFSGGGGAPPRPPATESRFVKIDGSTFVAGRKPASIAGGPVMTSVTGMFSVVNGGFGNYTIKFTHPNGLDKVTEAIVAINSDAGYMTLPITEPTTGQFTITIFIKENFDSRFSPMMINFAAKDVDGKVSNYIAKQVIVITTGTGDVKVSLTFDQTEDLDLHVWEPKPDGSKGGEHIYFAHKTSATGGQLDLDSNAGCSIDGIDNENIFWPLDKGPRGVYQVQVHYWAHCAPVTTFPVNWIIAVIRKGQAPVIYTGTYDAPTEVDMYKPEPAIEFTY